MKMKTQCGFTLTEMLVTLAVLAILLALAAPSYQRLVVDTRMTTQANELLTMMHFARSEAVKRNTVVSMCKSGNGTSCAGSGTWAQGWIVFVDSGTPGTVDGSDVVLREHGALSEASTLVDCTGVTNFFSYLSTGQSNPQTARFELGSPIANLDGRDIRLHVGGRPTVARATPPLACS